MPEQIKTRQMKQAPRHCIRLLSMAMPKWWGILLEQYGGSLFLFFVIFLVFVLEFKNSKESYKWVDDRHI